MQELERQFKANGGTFEEYRVGDLFSCRTGDVDVQRKHLNGRGQLYINSGVTNLGIIGRTDYKATIFPANTITVDMFGNAYFRDFEYKMATHAHVFSLTFLQRLINEPIGLYICVQMKYFTKMFSFSNMCNWTKMKEMGIYLPTFKGGIAFDYMESVIHELENERIIKLNAYLKSSGLENTKLTQEEKDAVLKLGSGGIEWKEFKIGDFFESSNGDFDIQKTHINNKGDYVITAGLTDNGILGKTDIKARVFDPHTITVDMFGSAFYRNFKYKMVTHARVFSLKSKIDINDEIGFFIATSFSYLAQLFGYGNMCSWDKIQNYTIFLPITAEGEIDWDFMQNLITAESRLAIRGVVEWKDKVINNTKK